MGLPLFKVYFDLLYDEGICFTGMDPYEQWPLVRVKIVFGCREGVWLCVQLFLHLVSLIFIILINIESLKHSGRNSSHKPT
uniref:Uncharacterized protein n=1 Tax=Torque teno Leptonychotes weddellii virus-1 TaxID=2012676 RepID=A0A1Z2RW68_9VIRU|nr:hypothetical protein [Torque teno Leptonychotes weddellii virus 1]ASA48608.1 hypothetical protein [Torque teno Leptonychotes weddellii virus 1]ASA48612.1 hypothetical protein [Torque teno Leptonychotes weddellii virus 1]ASA48824.1 hypothetical protein [Torque teno Leptonychotes weddellii virus 1]ASA48836.1 hypothetical protein [Torque teno Leptonychotes weddellii virus 1]